MSNKKCLGCGAELSINPNDVGYTKDLNMDYCISCYRLKHYKDVTEHNHPNEIPGMNKNSLVLVVSSVLYLDLMFTYPINRYQEDLKIVYIVNQLDLLPPQTNYNYLYKRIKEEANLYHAEYEDIILMSATHQEDIEKLKKYLMSYQDIKDVYLLGVQNSGKTTILNALTNENLALVDVKAGLTQDTITKDFKHLKIHDLPGLYQGDYIHNILPYKEYRKLIPTKEIKPVIFNLKVKESLLYNDIFSLHLIKGNGSVVSYFNNLDIRRINIENLENQLSTKLSYTKHILKLSNDIKYQITIADIGVIHLNGPKTVQLVIPKGLHISLKEAFFL
ncbi:MAG: GTPase [Acholeplasmataceae bacterium]